MLESESHLMATKIKPPGNGAWIQNGWDNILDLSKKGTEVTGTVLGQIEKGVAIAKGF